jgi:hypothetical protein
VVYRSIFTNVNADVEAEALRLGQPVFLNRYETSITEGADAFWDMWKKQSENNQASGK